MAPTLFQHYNTHYFIEHVKRPNTFVMAKRHAHEEFEIYYLNDGDRNFFIHDRVYNLVKGNLLIIPPGIIHRSTAGQHSYHERILVEFKLSYMQKLMHPDFINMLSTILPVDTCQIYELSPVKCRAIENLFHRYTTQQRKSSDELPVALFFHELLQFLRELDSPIKKDAFLHPSQLHERVSTIIQYINAHYSEDIGLNTVAAKHFISPEHLSRSFKQISGFTFNDYLINLRLSEAIYLLKESSLSVSDIAKAVGYQSHTHFGRSFKSNYGVSPSNYRKKVKPI